MNYLWGSFMFLIGLLITVGSVTKSSFVIYRLLHARAKLLWKDKAHTFLLVVGIIIMAFSSGFFFNVF